MTPAPKIGSKTMSDRIIIPNRKIIIREKYFRPWHFFFITLGAVIFLFRGYAQVNISSSKMEYGYSRNIYPYIADIFSLPGKWIPAPCSASELFLGTAFLAALIWFCCQLYLCFRKQKSVIKLLFKTLIHLIALVAGGYFFYLTVWGMNYLRESFAVSLNRQSFITLQASDYENTAEDMVLLANTFQRNPYNTSKELNELNEKTDRAVKNVISLLISSPLPSPPPVKFLRVNEVMNACGISGIFLPVFMESHINSDLLLWEQPYIMAHEKAHFMGFASETDASFIAYIACLSSESALMRYSSVLHILLALRPYLTDEKWDQAIKKLSPPVQQDIQERENRIRSYQGRYERITRLSRKVNDTYLKLNSQELGIRSYQAALPHLTLWWKKQRKMTF
ncbi:MAG: hypothetical protein BWK80_28000 [Desulfobacteraceae bacterium IS3]|nr:MAG: hypothetical protein BWK80_28000 [Desulfobacteraceae bacterium IS3]